MTFFSQFLTWLTDPFPQKTLVTEILPLTPSSSPDRFCSDSCGPYPFKVEALNTSLKYIWNDSTPLGNAIAKARLDVFLASCDRQVTQESASALPSLALVLTFSLGSFDFNALSFDSLNHHTVPSPTCFTLFPFTLPTISCAHLLISSLECQWRKCEPNTFE